MAVKDYPNISRPDGETWKLRYNTQSFTSDLNGISQTLELPGAKWEATVSYSSRFGREARILGAFFTGLKGMVGRFWFTPSDWEPYGTPSGTGAVSVAALGGASSLSTNGWTASITELFVAGDWFEINGELKKVTATVGSDATGNATIQFAPPLRLDALVGNVIRYNEPRCMMKLADDSQASWALSAPIIYATSLEFVEALDI